MQPVLEPKQIDRSTPKSYKLHLSSINMYSYKTHSYRFQQTTSGPSAKFSSQLIETFTLTSNDIYKRNSLNFAPILYPPPHPKNEIRKLLSLGIPNVPKNSILSIHRHGWRRMSIFFLPQQNAIFLRQRSLEIKSRRCDQIRLSARLGK